MEAKWTITAREHYICPVTGYCTKCGAHSETITWEDLLCIYAENSTAISHIRASKILKQKLDVVASQVKPVL